MTDKQYVIAFGVAAAFLIGGVVLYLKNGEIPTQIPSPSALETIEPSTMTITETDITPDTPEPGYATEPVEESSEPVSEPAPSYKSVITTKFWVGEQSDASNGYIPNHESYWDDQWLTHFGGVDDPECRKGFNPCGFTPKENPFYVALPYGEYIEGSGEVKASVKNIPWFKENSTEPLLKNRWVEVKFGDRICYGQLQDVGPFLTDDFAYVFGNAKPSNTFGVHAGLDISPALWDCLGLTTNETTSWRFIDATKVPKGPWKEIITTRGISWE